MTSVVQLRRAIAAGWRNFRRWRRGRPFWGGLFLLLSGLETFSSGQLGVGALQVRIGIEGFQFYLIPAMLGLAGLLVWLTPAHRIFYGVLATLVAVYALVGTNLGGFFLGTLLGILGGALSASWAPIPLAPPMQAAPEDAVSEPEDAVSELASPVVDDAPQIAEPVAVHSPDEPMADPTAEAAKPTVVTGPLTDILPPAGPLPIPRPRRRTGASTGETRTSTDDKPDLDPGGPKPGGAGPRLLSAGLIPLALTLAATGILPTVAAKRAPVPSTASAAAELPPVAAWSGQLTAARVSVSGLCFTGVVDVPTGSGSVRALSFAMRTATTTGFTLRISSTDGVSTVLTSTTLTLEGNVRLHATRVRGKVRGGPEVTYTPDKPPRTVPSEMFFTDVELTLVLLQADRLTATDLRVAVLT